MTPAINETYFKEYFSQTIAIGIGVHAGTVIKGAIRLGPNTHRVVMGHAVNVAARLQNATKELNNSFMSLMLCSGNCPILRQGTRIPRKGCGASRSL